MLLRMRPWKISPTHFHVRTYTRTRNCGRFITNPRSKAANSFSNQRDAVLWNVRTTSLAGGSSSTASSVAAARRRCGILRLYAVSVRQFIGRFVGALARPSRARIGRCDDGKSPGASRRAGRDDERLPVLYDYVQGTLFAGRRLSDASGSRNQLREGRAERDGALFLRHGARGQPRAAVHGPTHGTQLSRRPQGRAGFRPRLRSS